MPGNRAQSLAQDQFLREQRRPATKIIIGDSASPVQPIGTEGLIIKPAKRTKEEEERLAKTRSATIQSPTQIIQSGVRGITRGMGGRHNRP